MIAATRRHDHGPGRSARQKIVHTNAENADVGLHGVRREAGLEPEAGHEHRRDGERPAAVAREVRGDRAEKREHARDHEQLVDDAFARAARDDEQRHEREQAGLAVEPAAR